MTAAEFETSLQDKNDLRRASGLPLYDVERELARFHTDQQAAAYAAFVSAHLKPHTRVWDSEPSPTCRAGRPGRPPGWNTTGDNGNS